MMMRMTNCCFCLLMSVLGVVHAAEQEQVELSLRLTNDRQGHVRHIQVFVKNTSQNDIKLESKELRPPFPVYKWFRWSVDGMEAQYLENVAMVTGAHATWQIPPGGVVLWAEFPLGHLTVRTESGHESAVKDAERHQIRISASTTWKDLTVKSFTLTIGSEDTEQPPERDK